MKKELNVEFTGEMTVFDSPMFRSDYEKGISANLEYWKDVAKEKNLLLVVDYKDYKRSSK